MKRIFTLCAALCTLMTGFGQVDSTAKKNEPDTIKVGGMVIIREKGDNDKDNEDKSYETNTEHKYKKSPVSTNWCILDLGFSNYTDNTDYAAAAAMGTVPQGFNKNDMRLNTWRSRSVNIWLFMQRISIIKHYVNFKYGLGVELNNYYYDDKSIHFLKYPFGIDKSLPANELKKNKLAADYITMPFMLNINFVPHKYRPYGISAGVSIGYLYSARQKTKTAEGDIEKTKSIDLDPWKLSYVGEVSLGIIKIYGSYSIKSMFDYGMDVVPWTVGLRFSNW